MGAITRVSVSRHISGMNCGGLSRWSINPGSRSFLRSLCPSTLSPHVARSFHYARTSDRKRWLHSSHKMNVTSYISLNNVVSQKLTDESSAEARTTRAINFCKGLTVFAIVLSTILGGTPAQAGVESTLQPKFNGLVDPSTNKISSVEAILAKQLARRFREMSDEELILVLQELLKASRSSVSPEDLVLDRKGWKDGLLEDGSRKDNRKPVDVGPVTKDPVPQAGEARNGRSESSSSSSKFEDSITKDGKEDNYNSVDGIDTASESKGGEAKSGGPEMSVPGSKSVDQVPKQEKSVLRGTGRVPSFSKGTASEEALTTKNSRSSAVATEERDEAEQTSERSDKVPGELESQDMTGILWDEWRSRLEDQTILESSNNKESSAVSSTTDFWQKMKTSSMSALKGASNFFAWIGDNREALGGGILASGSIFFVLFIRQKILALSLGKGIENERDLKVDRTPTSAQLSASNLKNSGQVPWGFLQAVPISFKAARNRLLGAEEGFVQVEKATSDTTTSQSSGESTTSGSSDVSLYIEPGPATKPSEDDMLPKRQEARVKSRNTTQDESSYAARFLRPSERLPDRFVKRTNDKQGDTRNDGPVSRFKKGPETGDAVYESGLDDFRTSESLDLQGRKNGKEDDVVYKNPQFPPSVSATVDTSNKKLESSAREENMSRHMIDDSTLTGTRGSPLTSNIKEERSSTAKSFHGSVEGMTVGKRTGGEPREKVELAPSERKRDVGKFNSFRSKFSPIGSRETDVKGYSVPDSANQPSLWFSSRPIQLDPLAYKRKTADKELDMADLQDRFASESIFPDEMEEGVSSSKSASTKSTSFLSGSAGEKGPSSVQVTQGGEATSRILRFKGSPRSSKTFSPTNAGSNRLEDYGLGSEPPQKAYTEEILPTRTGKQDPVRDDPLKNNRSTLVRDPDQFSVLNEAQHVEYAAGSQGDNAGAPAKFMDIQSKAIHLEIVHGQRSGTDVPNSGAEQNRDRDNISKIISTGAPDTALEILPKWTRESLKVSENEVRDGKVAELPVSSEQGANLIPQEMRYDEGIIRLATIKIGSLEAEVEKNENSSRSSASNADAGDTGRDMHRDDVWASSATTAFGGKGFKHPYNDAIKYKSDDFEASSNGGREFDSKRAGQSRPELDSFFHKQNFWVRDSDGVFIKHPRESQGMILQDREGSRVTSNDRGLKNEAVDAWIAPKRPLTKLNRDAGPAGEARLHKQRSSSSGFDYRQLYLTPNDDNKTSGEPYESKIYPGSKKYTTFPNPSGTGKTRPIRYGVERTR